MKRKNSSQNRQWLSKSWENNHDSLYTVSPSLLWPGRVSSLPVSDQAALTAAVAVADDERMLVEVRAESHGQAGGQVTVMAIRHIGSAGPKV